MATILCIGDIHLGRPIRSLPAEIERAGIRPEQLGPGAAFDGAVDLAVSRGVDAVLLAGDVADEANRYYESLRSLERGVGRLVEAGIPILAVAGNHDADVLPRLAAQVPGFTLLGANGTWTTHPIERDGRVVARVIGWSFPTGAVHESPLETWVEPAPGAGPLIGLVHGDLDQPRSRYAPLSRPALRDAGADAWLLGHVHIPGLEGLRAARPIGYLGSLVGLDPSETGPHGPWLLDVSDGRLTMEHLPTAPLRWEQQDVPVDDLDTPDDLAPRLVRALHELHERLRPSLGGARAVVARLRLTGRAAHPAALEARGASLDVSELMRPIDDVTYFVDRVDCDVALDLDLRAMAAGGDPAALLARTLLLLDAAAPSAERTALLDGARRSLERTIAGPNWAILGRDTTIDDDALVARLRRAGMRALEAMLETRRESTGAH